MEVGATIWVRHPEEAWVGGRIVRKTEGRGGTNVTVVQENSKEEKVFAVRGEEQETEEIKYMNSSFDDSTPHDLTTLHHLN